MPVTAGEPLRLEAGGCTAAFSPRGAELISWVIGGRELIWQGDPAHWARHAPILFPVVGASVNGLVQVGGRRYPMPQHGFARDCVFTAIAHDANWLHMRLIENDTTWRHYPFRFVLDVQARLAPERLEIAFEVTNTDTADMPYALGFHPAFPWPFDVADRRGHSVVFESAESPDIPDVVSGGLLKLPGRRLDFDGTRLPLEPALFTEALVFLDAKSRVFSFVSPSGAAIELAVEDFPHLAVWSKPEAPFVSLEAWTGHADMAGFSGELGERASIRVMHAGHTARHVVSLAWRPGAE
jgi:galactose mutarotase-like enzyme